MLEIDLRFKLNGEEVSFDGFADGSASGSGYSGTALWLKLKRTT
jgi:hypothetical protein